jgi:flagellar hook-basal body complex protein FliE
MNVYTPTLVTGDKIPMTVTNPRHMVPQVGDFKASGSSLAALGDQVGAQGVLDGAGSFEKAMLQALDSVNSDQNESTDLMQTMITDPESVDPHDVTIAMAKANLSLNIARTVLSRVVQDWKEIINTR